MPPFSVSSVLSLVNNQIDDHVGRFSTSQRTIFKGEDVMAMRSSRLHFLCGEDMIIFAVLQNRSPS